MHGNNYRRHIITRSNHRGTGIWLITHEHVLHRVIHSFRDEILPKSLLNALCSVGQNGLRMVSSWEEEEVEEEKIIHQQPVMLRNVRGPEIKLVDEKNAHLFAHIDIHSQAPQKRSRQELLSLVA